MTKQLKITGKEQENDQYEDLMAYWIVGALSNRVDEKEFSNHKIQKEHWTVEYFFSWAEIAVILIPFFVDYASVINPTQAPPCSPGHQQAPVVKNRHGNDKQPVVIPVSSWVQDKQFKFLPEETNRGH